MTREEELNKGVEQGKKEMLDKVCEWLYAHNQKMAKMYGAKDVLSCADYIINVDELKKAMEDK